MMSFNFEDFCPAFRFRQAVLILVLTALLPLSPAAANSKTQEGEAWELVGRQGIVQYIIVPSDKLTDRSAYLAEIKRRCPALTTCFINFYANPSGVKPELPLPDAIFSAVAARYRRSLKSGMELLEWSCRLGVKGGDCF